MKHLLFFMLFIATGYSLAAQARIHAHNDYQQARPLTNALRNRVYCIEADVYAGNNGPLVAHSKEDICSIDNKSTG